VPGELNNVTTANAYTRDTTRQAPRSTRVRLIVRNASIYYQLGYGGRAGAVNFDEEPERFLPPGTWFDWTIAAHIVDEDYGTHVSWGISQDGLADTQIRFQFAVDNIDPGVEVLGWFYLVFIGHP
jgi:hypothetical protein